MATPPSLDPAARAAALEKAKQVRLQRAELKNRLKMGSVSLADVLDQAETDDIAGKLKVVTLLESLPKVGKVKARRVMEEIGIAENRKVQGLGERQKQALLEQLG